MPDAEETAARLAGEGVAGVSIGWVGTNGIVRTRVVPVAELPGAVRRGTGGSTLLSVSDSRDGITWAHEGSRRRPVASARSRCSTPPAGVVPLAGQPGMAWVPPGACSTSTRSSARCSATWPPTASGSASCTRGTARPARAGALGLDPLVACDAQVLARQHGLRVSLAPVATTTGVGNGRHLHTSLSRDGRNVLTGDDEHGLSAAGRGYLTALLRELPGWSRRRRSPVPTTPTPS